MIWIWLSVIVVLFGAELNAEIEHQTAMDSTTGPPAADGRARRARWPTPSARPSEQMAVEAPKPKTPPMSGDKLGPKH